MRAENPNPDRPERVNRLQSLIDEAYAQVGKVPFGTDTPSTGIITGKRDVSEFQRRTTRFNIIAEDVTTAQIKDIFDPLVSGVKAGANTERVLKLFALPDTFKELVEEGGALPIIVKNPRKNGNSLSGVALQLGDTNQHLVVLDNRQMFLASPNTLETEDSYNEYFTNGALTFPPDYQSFGLDNKLHRIHFHKQMKKEFNKNGIAVMDIINIEPNELTTITDQVLARIAAQREAFANEQLHKEMEVYLKGETEYLLLLDKEK